jgi:hypothetical protein
MCDYYQNALFTISPAHSANSRGGLFVQRDGIRILPFEIEIQLPDKAMRCQFAPAPRREVRWSRRDLPLYKRACALQELILSPRAQIFDPDTIRWEYLSGYGSERSLDTGKAGGEHRRVGFASWKNCTWYGFDCCSLRHDKAKPYEKLAKAWGRVKLPVLAANRTMEHPEEPHSIPHMPLPSRTAYHTDVRMERRTVRIE